MATHYQITQVHWQVKEECLEIMLKSTSYMKSKMSVLRFVNNTKKVSKTEHFRVCELYDTSSPYVKDKQTYKMGPKNKICFIITHSRTKNEMYMLHCSITHAWCCVFFVLLAFVKYEQFIMSAIICNPTICEVSSILVFVCKKKNSRRQLCEIYDLSVIIESYVRREVIYLKKGKKNNIHCNSTATSQMRQHNLGRKS